MLEDESIKSEPKDSGYVKVENFSDSEILSADTPDESSESDSDSADVKPSIRFFEKSSRPAKRLKKSDFLPVLCQIFEKSDPRTTKLPIFEFKVADNFFLYIFKIISLQNFQKTDTFELTCVAFPKCRCKIKIKALITTDLTDEIFSKNRNWSIVPPKRVSTLIQSHNCESIDKNPAFQIFAKVGRKRSMLRQGYKASKDMHIFNIEKISNTAGQFSIYRGKRGKKKNYAFKLKRSNPALLSSFRIDCTEKGDSSSLRVFAVETVDPDDPTFWSPQNWRVKANQSEKHRKNQILLPRAGYKKGSNSRKISSDSELDQISLDENFLAYIKKQIFEKFRSQNRGGRSKKTGPRYKFSDHRIKNHSRNILIENAKSRLNNIFNEKKISKASVRHANNFSDREIYSESDLDHVEISDEFDLYLSQNIPHNVYEPDIDTRNDPDYDPKFNR